MPDELNGTFTGESPSEADMAISNRVAANSSTRAMHFDEGDDHVILPPS